MLNSKKELSSELLNSLNKNKKFSKKWSQKKILNKIITQTTNYEPDLIYINEDKKLLILIITKNKIKFHQSKNLDKPQNYAVDGIKHHLSYFLSLNKQKKILENFNNYRFVGIAFSGDINNELNHKTTTFIIDNSKIKKTEIINFLDENSYLALFENLDLELITNNISKSSSEINKILRNIDSQKRPVLLSALMICLYEKNNSQNNFKLNYKNWDIKNIIKNIPITISNILKDGGVDQNKIDVLINELAFIKTDKDLNDTDILKNILTELEYNVIPLFYKQTSYDIIGKFYEEFLKYAGVSNVKKGIVLTPNHITKLFTDLIDIKPNDIIFDPCCGTGAFLIAAMNKLIETIQNSDITNKTEKIKYIKQKQLVGFEKSPTMYSLAISNILFRGDGKNKVFNIDFFEKEADKILKNIKPTICFINPPYGGKDNKSNPTKKEIQFLEKMLDSVSRYGIIIAPLSTYFKDSSLRNKILSKHTLKAVINMPNELFAPNASTHTAIAIFKTNIPHNNKEVTFFNLKDDGFVLSKNKGRTDIYNKWDNIKNDLLKKLKNPQKYNDNIDLVYKNIKENDEWIIQAHMKTDYSNLSKNDFIIKIKEYVIFIIKKEFNLLNKKIDELTFMELVLQNNLTSKPLKTKEIDLYDVQWQEFKIDTVFKTIRGKRLKEEDRLKGNIEYYSASEFNNGLTDFISNPLFLEKNGLIYTTFGDCFFVENQFTASDEISILKHQKLNIYNGLFISTILKQNKYKYTFGRKAFTNKLLNDIIKLPVLEKNTPNWQFMEDYVKSLPYSSNISKETLL